MYQTLDSIDGKQARRTNSSSPLGELFDHGCDAVSAGTPTLSIYLYKITLRTDTCYVTRKELPLVSFLHCQYFDRHTSPSETKSTLDCGSLH